MALSGGREGLRWRRAVELEAHVRGMVVHVRGKRMGRAVGPDPQMEGGQDWTKRVNGSSLDWAGAGLVGRRERNRREMKRVAMVF